VGVIAGTIGILIALLITVGGQPLIATIFGKKYLESFDLLSLMTWSLMISMASFPLESLLYMAGRQKAALVAQIGAVSVYLTALYALTRLYGLTGAGMAYLIGTMAMAAFMLIPVWQSYRRRTDLSHHNQLASASL
jgi:O-antigen/teichoic acid export membrane protein